MKGYWRSIECPHECVRICTDYVITLPVCLLRPTSKPYAYECVCVCVRLLSCCPSHLCVNVGRGDQYERKKGREEKRKSVARRPLPHRVSLRSRHWATRALCACAVSPVIGDRKALDAVEKRRRRKKEERNRDRHVESKAREGVPVAHTRSLASTPWS